MKKTLSHTDADGRARMVDVGGKPESDRVAVAEGFIRLSSDTIALVHENAVKKGDVLTLAEVAGTMAAKQTSTLIPLCHPLLLNKVQVVAHLEKEGVRVDATVRCSGKTGVEMEALTAVSVALLTIYDMCKAVDKGMVISDIRLLEKTKQERK